MSREFSKEQSEKTGRAERGRQSFMGVEQRTDKDSDESSVRAPGRRVLRVEKELREIVGLHLVGGFHGELYSMVTISRVSVTSDLRSARIYVSVLGPEKEQEETLAILNKYTFEVQREIARAMPTRYCPKVKFFLDKTLEKVLKVEKILFEISRQKTNLAGTP